ATALAGTTNHIAALTRTIQTADSRAQSVTNELVSLSEQLRQVANRVSGTVVDGAPAQQALRALSDASNRLISALTEGTQDASAKIAAMTDAVSRLNSAITDLRNGPAAGADTSVRQTIARAHELQRVLQDIINAARDSIPGSDVQA